MSRIELQKRKLKSLKTLSRVQKLTPLQTPAQAASGARIANPPAGKETRVRVVP
jgi:hypothetical protein